jgi:hypothetical protein
MARNASDTGLLVRFYKTIEPRVIVGIDGKEDTFESVERDCISIIVPGSRDEHCGFMNDDYKVRFKEEYAAWKSAEGKPIMGLPLAEWPLATVSFVSEMASYGVRSVEELAELPEAFSVSPSSLTMKAKAQAWLEARKNMEASASIATENDELKKRIAELESKAKK